MKSFIKNNKFFILLISILLLSIVLLSLYEVRENIKEHQPVIQEEVKPKPQVKPENIVAQISSLTAEYHRGDDGNRLIVRWRYEKNNSEIESVSLKLNDTTEIDVTSNSYYEFIQSVFAFPTGENTITLSLNLKDGKVIEKQVKVMVDEIIQTLQTYRIEANNIYVSLEYIYDKNRPVEVPSILITNISNHSMPSVKYVKTQYRSNGNQQIATTTFQFTWTKVADLPTQMSLRWKFNSSQDSFDYTIYMN